jgi:hypothetical protein
VCWCVFQKPLFRYTLQSSLGEAGRGCRCLPCTSKPLPTSKKCNTLLPGTLNDRIWCGTPRRAHDCTRRPLRFPRFSPTLYRLRQRHALREATAKPQELHVLLPTGRQHQRRQTSGSVTYPPLAMSAHIAFQCVVCEEWFHDRCIRDCGKYPVNFLPSGACKSLPCCFYFPCFICASSRRNVTENRQIQASRHFTSSLSCLRRNSFPAEGVAAVARCLR